MKLFNITKIREHDLIKDLALYFRNSIINEKYQPKIDLQDYLKHSPLLKAAIPEIDHLKLRLNEYRNYDSHREFLQFIHYNNVDIGREILKTFPEIHDHFNEQIKDSVFTTLNIEMRIGQPAEEIKEFLGKDFADYALNVNVNNFSKIKNALTVSGFSNLNDLINDVKYTSLKDLCSDLKIDYREIRDHYISNDDSLYDVHKAVFIRETSKRAHDIVKFVMEGIEIDGESFDFKYSNVIKLKNR